MTQQVLLDTDVYSVLHVHRRTSPVGSRWRSQLRGVPVAVSFQTREELLAGAYIAEWGPIRLDDLVAQLSDLDTVEADPSVVEASARLTACCVQHGHPLHQKIHRADRWIAASAMAYDLPLATMDGVYAGVAGLDVVSLEGSAR